MYSDNYIPNTGNDIDVLDLYKQEVMDIRQDGAFMGIWQIFQAANILKWPIQSVFPNIVNENVIKDLNRTVYCIDRANNAKCSTNLMWIPMQVKNSRRCHFVPLLKVVRAYEQYIKYVKCTSLLVYLMLFFILSLQTS